MREMSRETIVNACLALGLLAVPLVALAIDEAFYVTLATRVAIFALAGVGLNLALGIGGLVSFGHAAFFGIGGYVAGILASHALNYDPMFTWPVTFQGTTAMLAIWPAAILVSGLFALVIGALSLRTSGVYFIMITLAFAQMLYYFALSWRAYGGDDGLSIYLRSTFPGVNTQVPLTFFLICYVLLMLAILLVARLRAARFGSALEAARQNEERLAAIGIRPYRIRLAAFTLSGMITGLAGALFADLNRFVSPTMFSWQTSGEIMVFVILGGVGRLFGPLAGAAVFIVFETVLGGMTERWQFFLGLVLLAVVLFARGGLVGLLAGRARHG